MKTRQVLHFVDLGKEYSVIKHYGKTNPYRIYRHYSDIGPDGVMHDHRKQVETYANLESCFYWFLQNNIGR